MDAALGSPPLAGVVPDSVLAACRGELLDPDEVHQGVVLMPWSVRRELRDRLAEHQVQFESAGRLTAHVPCEHDGREFSCALVFTVTLDQVAPLVAVELCAYDAQGRDPFVQDRTGPRLAHEVLEAVRGRLVDGEFASDLPPVGSVEAIVATLLVDSADESGQGRHVQLSDALIMLSGAAAGLRDVVSTARALDGKASHLGGASVTPPSVRRVTGRAAVRSSVPVRGA